MQQQLNADILKIQRTPSNVLFSGILGGPQKRKAKKLCHELGMDSIDENRFMHGTCLQEQSYLRDEALVQDLMDAGADVNANARSDWESALFCALYSDEGRDDSRGNAVAVKLIDAGADALQVLNEDGDFAFRWPSLLHMAADGYGAIDAYEKKTTNVFKSLCAAGIAADPERFREIMSIGTPGGELLSTLYAMNIGQDDVRWRRHDGSIPTPSDPSWQRWGKEIERLIQGLCEEGQPLHGVTPNQKVGTSALDAFFNKRYTGGHELAADLR